MRPREVVLRSLRPLLGGVQINHLVRLLPVAELVDVAGPRSVLDVGSGSRGLARWLPAHVGVVALDHDFEDYGAARRPSGRATPVLGDVGRLPFVDRSFDLVVAIDLLEHLPSARRAAALQELARVTRHHLIVAGPTGVDAHAADAALMRILRTRGSAPPGWLIEHLDNGFPDADEVAAQLRRHGEVEILPNLNVDAHVRITLRDLTASAFLVTRLQAAALGFAYRRIPSWRGRTARILSRLRGADATPVYRSIVTLRRPSCSTVDRA